MAIRPVFVPVLNGPMMVRTEMVEFVWHPGMALSQKRKSIASLHQAAEQMLSGPFLEVSTRSPDALGTRLSAFNLTLSHPKAARPVSVECAFQAGKVFGEDGPFLDLLTASSSEAKRDLRLHNSGPLTSFQFGAEAWPLEPRTAFYDWLYITALSESGLIDAVAQSAGFTDIEFNPKKSINCQAHATAIALALRHRGLLNPAIASKNAFLDQVTRTTQVEPSKETARQGSLF